MEKKYTYKPYSLRLREYEEEKKKLIAMALSCKEDEPFWVRVTKEHIRGSASIEQIAWNVLGIEQEIMPDRSRGRARWVFLKNREGGDLGIADVFSINDDDWSVKLYDEGEEFIQNQQQEKQTVTIKPKCFDDDDPELGF